MQRTQFLLEPEQHKALTAISRIERLEQLHSAYRERLRAQRAAKRLRQTLDVLFERPILNIRTGRALPDGAVVYRDVGGNRHLARRKQNGA